MYDQLSIPITRAEALNLTLVDCEDSFTTNGLEYNAALKYLHQSHW